MESSGLNMTTLTSTQGGIDSGDNVWEESMPSTSRIDYTENLSEEEGEEEKEVYPTVHKRKFFRKNSRYAEANFEKANKYSKYAIRFDFEPE